MCILFFNENWLVPGREGFTLLEKTAGISRASRAVGSWQADLQEVHLHPPVTHR